MRLWEEVADERGDKFPSELGRATWDQTPSNLKRDFVIQLNTRPQSDTLFLETDNGDNPAIEPRDFRAYYPATRVLFEATFDPAKPIWLYYGNRDATAPHYDLALGSRELLGAERTNIVAGAGENLSSSTNRVGQALTGSSRYIFWGARSGCDRAARNHVTPPAQIAAMKRKILPWGRRLLAIGVVYLAVILFGRLPDHLILFPSTSPTDARGAIRTTHAGGNRPRTV